MTKHVAVAIAVLAAPVAVLSGCSKQSSTNPSATSTSTTSGSAGGQTLTTQLNTADGKHVADATVDFTNGYATVTVETVAAGILSPGFHGLHIHAVGKCEGDFTSAGGHFQASGHTGQPASGDLPPLLVRSDGLGKLVATTDGVTISELKGADGSSIVLHQGSDMGAESAADQRIACGVLSPASAGSTSVSTSVSTSTVTTTTAVPTIPPETATETTPSSTSATTTAPSASTSTSTVTVIQPTIPPITVPAPPGPNGG